MEAEQHLKKEKRKCVRKTLPPLPSLQVAQNLPFIELVKLKPKRAGKKRTKDFYDLLYHHPDLTSLTLYDTNNLVKQITAIRDKSGGKGKLLERLTKEIKRFLLPTFGKEETNKLEVEWMGPRKKDKYKEYYQTRSKIPGYMEERRVYQVDLRSKRKAEKQGKQLSSESSSSSSSSDAESKSEGSFPVPRSEYENSTSSDQYAWQTSIDHNDEHQPSSQPSQGWENMLWDWSTNPQSTLGHHAHLPTLTQPEYSMFLFPQNGDDPFHNQQRSMENQPPLYNQQSLHSRGQDDGVFGQLPPSSNFLDMKSPAPNSVHFNQGHDQVAGPSLTSHYEDHRYRAPVISPIAGNSNYHYNFDNAHTVAATHQSHFHNYYNTPYPSVDSLSAFSQPGRGHHSNIQPPQARTWNLNDNVYFDDQTGLNTGQMASSSNTDLNTGQDYGNAPHVEPAHQDITIATQSTNWYPYPYYDPSLKNTRH